MYFSMEGGELFQRIQERTDGAFTERGTVHNVIYYDYKLNILL